jgi:hypothetical protein
MPKTLAALPRSQYATALDVVTSGNARVEGFENEVDETVACAVGGFVVAGLAEADGWDWTGTGPGPLRTWMRRMGSSSRIGLYC